MVEIRKCLDTYALVKISKENLKFTECLNSDDAVRYIFSIKNGYFFVTGDKEFKDLPGVEFKKK